jgi:hypothetical protein
MYYFFRRFEDGQVWLVKQRGQGRSERAAMEPTNQRQARQEVAKRFRFDFDSAGEFVSASDSFGNVWP